jgi:hypothetical protein
MKRLITIVILLLMNVFAIAQSFVPDTTLFFKETPIKSFKRINSKENIIIYKTSLRLNTDGAPKSYHPRDLRADSLALNLIINGMAVYRKSDGFCISIPDKGIIDYHEKYKDTKKRPSDFTKEEKIQMIRRAYKVIEDFIANDYNQPSEYEIFWKSVFVNKDGRPCIFSSGENKGYFASMTAVDNGNIKDKGECDCNYYLDATKIPAIVLPKGKNALSLLGAKKENLVIAYNPETKKVTYAIIGDTGPASNLGEGNILMNQSLLKNVQYETNRQSINRALNISKSIIICVIPTESTSHLKPYSEEKIKAECENWIRKSGFKSTEEFIVFLTKNAS